MFVWCLCVFVCSEMFPSPITHTHWVWWVSMLRLLNIMYEHMLEHNPWAESQPTTTHNWIMCSHHMMLFRLALLVSPRLVVRFSALLFCKTKILHKSHNSHHPCLCVLQHPPSICVLFFFSLQKYITCANLMKYALWKYAIRSMCYYERACARPRDDLLWNISVLSEGPKAMKQHMRFVMPSINVLPPLLPPYAVKRRLPQFVRIWT